jgi:hypothetical protein
MPAKLVLASLALVAGSLFVAPQDEKKKPDAPQDEKKKPAPAAPSPEQMKEMMEAMQKAATPGPEHKGLQKLVGKWNTVAKTADMPGMPAEETKGTSEYRSVLGGRQVVGETKGTMMGMQFDGFHLLGYDNVTKEYVSTWTDTMSSGHYMTRGTADASGKVITMKGEMRDAMTPDAPRPWKLVVKIESDDRHVTEVYDTMEPGTEPGLVVTVTSTRVK